jgi:hypothetical protein
MGVSSVVFLSFFFLAPKSIKNLSEFVLLRLPARQVIQAGLPNFVIIGNLFKSTAFNMTIRSIVY